MSVDTREEAQSLLTLTCAFDWDYGRYILMIPEWEVGDHEHLFEVGEALEKIYQQMKERANERS